MYTFYFLTKDSRDFFSNLTVTILMLQMSFIIAYFSLKEFQGLVLLLCI